MSSLRNIYMVFTEPLKFKKPQISWFKASYETLKDLLAVLWALSCGSLLLILFLLTLSKVFKVSQLICPLGHLRKWWLEQWRDHFLLRLMECPSLTPRNPGDSRPFRRKLGIVVIVVKSLSCVQLFATLWTVAYRSLLSMGFSRHEHCSGLPFPTPGDLLNPGIKPTPPALTSAFFSTEPPEKTSEDN